MKNELLKRHFLNPSGMKSIENPSYVAICKSDTCSDVIRMAVIVDSAGKVSDIGTEVYGCGYSIAGASLFNSNALNMHMENIINNSENIIDEVTDEVSEHNKTCIELTLNVFKLIYEQYKTDKQ